GRRRDRRVPGQEPERGRAGAVPRETPAPILVPSLTSPRRRRPLRCALAVATALGLGLAAARTAAAQAQAVRLTVRLADDASASGSRAPIVRSENLLADGRWLTALRSGLPVRLHYRVEVWRSRGGWFDAFERQADWDVVLRHEPLLDQYTVLTLVGGRAQERRYATIDALSTALAFSYQVSVRPAAAGRYYYAASLEISTRWRGERRGSETRSAAARPGSCCGWRGCRVSGSRCAARRSTSADGDR